MNTRTHVGLRRHSLTCAVSAALALIAGQAVAQTDDNDTDDRIELEEIVVTAVPIQRSALELTQSATVLQGEELNSELRNSLGDTIFRLPGLSNASFGENVGRPVIRGQQKFRVGVLQDGMNIFDASAPSQDHAVATEPFLADQVEVLRGPNTLLYGSSAIGGVVNVVTNTIPLTVPADGFEGRAMVQGDTAADERLGAARLDFGAGNFAVHVNGFYRRTDDYEIPGAAELFPDEDHEDHEDHEDEDHGHEEDEVTGILENSFLDNEGGAIGGAWIGETWRAGLSWTAYSSNYGIPGGHAHAHAHGEEEHEGEDHDEDHDEDHNHEEEEEEIVTIDLESSRIDGIISGTDPFTGFSALDFKLAYTDYTHTEFEGEEIGTVFDSETTDLRLELTHNPWGDLEGTFGLQWSDNDFDAVGEEAFVPPSTTETWGLFLVETWKLNDRWLFDLGLRFEDTQVDSFLIEHEHEHEEDHEEGEHEDEPPMPVARDFNPFSISVGAKWEVTDNSHVTFNIARAERAPSATELFSNGPHIATQTFEIGNPDLGIETNNHYEASYRIKQGAVTGSFTVYHDDYDDFVYQVFTGEMEDGFPVAVWAQQDAEFTGGEIELRWDLGSTALGDWELFGFYDRVEADLADGGNVPRIPPQRFGLGVDWGTAQWAGNVTWINADDHTDTADFETPTPGYDLLNAGVSFFLPVGDNAADLEFYLKGRNLLDEDIRNSTSFLKDQAPQIGRNFVFGVRALF